MLVSCPSCFRRERRESGAVIVEQEGGRRRPAGHAGLAAWRSLREARDRGESAVGACPCGQPLLADAGLHPGMRWAIEVPGGSIEVGPALREIRGPDGPLAEAAADALLVGLYRDRLAIRPAQAAFQGVLLTALLAPVALWVVTVIIVVGFLIGYTTPPGFR